MRSKKGQSLSVNVIIVAALALIVLVVLIVVFTGRIKVFEQGVSKEGESELAKMRIFYGSCRPNNSFESKFLDDYSLAATAEGKAQASDDFKAEIDRCKEFAESKDVCEVESGCVWG